MSTLVVSPQHNTQPHHTQPHHTQPHHTQPHSNMSNVAQHYHHHSATQPPPHTQHSGVGAHGGGANMHGMGGPGAPPQANQGSYGFGAVAQQRDRAPFMHGQQGSNTGGGGLQQGGSMGQHNTPHSGYQQLPTGHGGGPGGGIIYNQQPQIGGGAGGQGDAMGQQYHQRFNNKNFGGYRDTSSNQMMSAQQSAMQQQQNYMSNFDHLFADDIAPQPRINYNYDRVENTLLDELCSDIGIKDGMDLDFVDLEPSRFAGLKAWDSGSSMPSALDGHSKLGFEDDILDQIIPFGEKEQSISETVVKPMSVKSASPSGSPIVHSTSGTGAGSASPISTASSYTVNRLDEVPRTPEGSEGSPAVTSSSQSSNEEPEKPLSSTASDSDSKVTVKTEDSEKKTVDQNSNIHLMSKSATNLKQENEAVGSSAVLRDLIKEDKARGRSSSVVGLTRAMSPVRVCQSMPASVACSPAKSTHASGRFAVPQSPARGLLAQTLTSRLQSQISAQSPGSPSRKRLQMSVGSPSGASSSPNLTTLGLDDSSDLAVRLCDDSKDTTLTPQQAFKLEQASPQTDQGYYSVGSPSLPCSQQTPQYHGSAPDMLGSSEDKVYTYLDTATPTNANVSATPEPNNRRLQQIQGSVRLSPRSQSLSLDNLPSRTQQDMAPLSSTDNLNQPLSSSMPAGLDTCTTPTTAVKYPGDNTNLSRSDSYGTRLSVDQTNPGSYHQKMMSRSSRVDYSPYHRAQPQQPPKNQDLAEAMRCMARASGYTAQPYNMNSQNMQQQSMQNQQQHQEFYNKNVGTYGNNPHYGVPQQPQTPGCVPQMPQTPSGMLQMPGSIPQQPQTPGGMPHQHQISNMMPQTPGSVMSDGSHSMYSGTNSTNGSNVVPQPPGSYMSPDSASSSDGPVMGPTMSQLEDGPAGQYMPDGSYAGFRPITPTQDNGGSSSVSSDSTQQNMPSQGLISQQKQQQPYNNSNNNNMMPQQYTQQQLGYPPMQHMPHGHNGGESGSVMPPEIIGDISKSTMFAHNNLLQRLISDKSSAFRSHPLFPLLRDLIVADMNFHSPSFPFQLIANLPVDFERLLQNYINRNPSVPSYRPDHSTEAVIMQALRHAHNILIDKISHRKQMYRRQGITNPKEMNEINDFVERFDRSVKNKMDQSGGTGSGGFMAGRGGGGPQMHSRGNMGGPHPQGYPPNHPQHHSNMYPPNHPNHPSNMIGMPPHGHMYPGGPMVDGRPMGPHHVPGPGGRMFGGPHGHMMGPMIPQPPQTQPTKKHQVLPKEAVAIMLEWLREHQKNPYPNDDEKDMLIHQTRLTINQINYWFTNARRRILPKWALQQAMDEKNNPSSTKSSSSGSTTTTTSSSKSSSKGKEVTSTTPSATTVIPQQSPSSTTGSHATPQATTVK